MRHNISIKQAGVAPAAHVRRELVNSMEERMRVALVVALTVIQGCSATSSDEIEFDGCTEAWFRYVEKQVPTGDGQGHGPDPGSTEWRSVIEFKLGIRNDPAVPPLESSLWCRDINDRVRKLAS